MGELYHKNENGNSAFGAAHQNVPGNQKSVIWPGMSAQINDLLRSCDQNCIPVATNVATAEMLIQGLARGDLAWREINPNANF